MLRDPRYLLPLAVLMGVILVSVAFARQRHESSAAVVAVATMTSTSTPEPVPTSTPDAASIDARRVADLRAIENALASYRRRNGSFPTTKKAVTTLCAKPADAGCALSSVMPGLKFADGDAAYWYRSDGATYHLIAPAKGAGDMRECPPQLPPALRPAPVICVWSGGGR